MYKIAAIIFAFSMTNVLIVLESDKIANKIDNMADAVHYATKGCVSLESDDESQD